MSKHMITGLINGKELPIAIGTLTDTPPFRVTIEVNSVLPKGIVENKIVGLQYLDSSMFVMLIEVRDTNEQVYHFLLESWSDIFGEPIYPLKVSNPYLYFNEEIRNYLNKGE